MPNHAKSSDLEPNKIRMVQTGSSNLNTFKRKMYRFQPCVLSLWFQPICESRLDVIRGAKHYRSNLNVNKYKIKYYIGVIANNLKYISYIHQGKVTS